MKYPPSAEDMEIGGSEIAKRRREEIVRSSRKMLRLMAGVQINRADAESRPKKRLYATHFLITARTDAVFPFLMRIPAEEISPRASDTNRVAARLTPEVASVMAKPYTVEMRVKSPIASAPTVFEI